MIETFWIWLKRLEKAKDYGKEIEFTLDTTPKTIVKNLQIYDYQLSDEELKKEG